MDMVTDKSLVGTQWQNRQSGELYLVKEQFRIGSDIESWVELRDLNDRSHMLQTDRLVLDYLKL